MTQKQMVTQNNKFKFNQVANQFSETVSKQIVDFSQTISSQEAKRLTLSLCVAANSAMEPKNFTWNQVKANEFVVDALRVVTMGLDASNNEVYVIPYLDNKSKDKDGNLLGLIDLDLSMSAWGWRKLVLKYAVGKKLEDLRAFAVRENDTFTLKQTASGDVYIYEPELFGTSPVKGYVTVAVYEDGTSKVMTHSLEDIEKRKKASKAPNSPAWTKWPEEMAIAKAIRRHCKTIPFEMPTEVESAMQNLDDPQKAAQREIDNNANTIDLPQSHVIEAELESDDEVMEQTQVEEIPMDQAFIDQMEFGGYDDF